MTKEANLIEFLMPFTYDYRYLAVAWLAEGTARHYVLTLNGGDDEIDLTQKPLSPNGFRGFCAIGNNILKREMNQLDNQKME